MENAEKVEKTEKVSPMIAINPHYSSVCQPVGQEQTPVIVIDDLLTDISAVLRVAVAQKYSPPPSVIAYPGIRATIDKQYSEPVLTAIKAVFNTVYGVPQKRSLQLKAAAFSLLSTPEKELDVRQCVPHFDSPQPDTFALLHYLNRGDFGGTSFYGHRPTGFENITLDRLSSYTAATQTFSAINGYPEKKYFTQSTTHFELLNVIDYKPNRLIIYPTTLLHSGYFEKPHLNVNDDPYTGRLTANLYVDFSL